MDGKFALHVAKSVADSACRQRFNRFLVREVDSRFDQSEYLGEVGGELLRLADGEGEGLELRLEVPAQG